ncbi:MAG: TadE/TadG family type IV pilus assembly protein [Vampirovibrionales bacterium]|nr:TadE/TadG family type IV pilus assembly protein [Vampirovibrionales bacterium]
MLIVTKSPPLLQSTLGSTHIVFDTLPMALPYPKPSHHSRLGLTPFRGQSIVELTLILPILLIMGLGIAEMGRLWQTYHATKLAAEDGAYTATIYNNEDNKGELAIDTRLSKAKLSAQTRSISAITSNGGIVLGYSANVTVNFKPFFPGLTLDVPGAGSIALFSGSIPIHYESVYSRKVM